MPSQVSCAPCVQVVSTTATPVAVVGAPTWMVAVAVGGGGVLARTSTVIGGGGSTYPWARTRHPTPITTVVRTNSTYENQCFPLIVPTASSGENRSPWARKGPTRHSVVPLPDGARGREASTPVHETSTGLWTGQAPATFTS